MGRARTRTRLSEVGYHARCGDRGHRSERREPDSAERASRPRNLSRAIRSQRVSHRPPRPSGDRDEEGRREQESVAKASRARAHPCTESRDEVAVTNAWLGAWLLTSGQGQSWPVVDVDRACSCCRPRSRPQTRIGMARRWFPTRSGIGRRAPRTILNRVARSRALRGAQWVQRPSSLERCSRLSTGALASPYAAFIGRWCNTSS